MIKNVVKILELLGDRLEVCVSVYVYKWEREKKRERERERARESERYGMFDWHPASGK